MSAKQLAKGITARLWSMTHSVAVCKAVHDRIIHELGGEWAVYDRLDDRWIKSVNEWYVEAMYV
jgi:hypothetical protein